METEKFNPITILVRSGDTFRCFTTQRFTIRHFIRTMQRYGTGQTIVMAFDDITPANLQLSEKRWTAMTREQLDEAMDFIKKTRNVLFTNTDKDWSKEQLLTANITYRQAINIYYCQNANKGLYPNEQPFSDVMVKIRKPIGYNRLERPVFLSDEDNKEPNVSDILKLYTGYRVRKLINGIPVSGYILKSSRF